ncbi:MAG: gamma-butyrobetaine hydroxylase-like domain-containing protein [Phycisphaerae bacterium]
MPDEGPSAGGGGHDVGDAAAHTRAGVNRASGGAARLDTTTTPADIKVKIAEQRLIVDWKDGRHTDLTFAILRKHCPCATCRAEREQHDDNPLQILKTDPTGLKVINAELVGTYAIQFHWSDGHNTGIFDFRFLRALADQA